jgi:hypothetical protein
MCEGDMALVRVRRESHGVVEISTTPWLTCIQHSEHGESLKSRKDKVFEICSVSFPFVIHVFSFIAVSFFYNHG